MPIDVVVAVYTRILQRSAHISQNKLRDMKIHYTYNQRKATENHRTHTELSCSRVIFFLQKEDKEIKHSSRGREEEQPA